MSLTSADIFEEVVYRLQALGDQVPSIDRELLSVLQDLSVRHDFLQSSGTVTTSDGTASYDMPTGFKHLLDAPLIGSSEVLEPVPFGRYNDWVTYEASSGEPDYYCIYNEDIFLYPTPDAAYSVTVRYAKRHAESTGTIEFGRAFLDAIAAGVLSRLFGGPLRRFEESAARRAEALGEYERHVATLAGNLVTRPARAVRYTDI